MTTSSDWPGSETLSARTLVMGILNVTPDSFSDGGRYLRVDRAVGHAMQMIADGADIIDIGGESTRPGSHPVSADEEIERVVAVIEALRRKTSIVISVDTSKPEVMRAAANAGASIINDVRALRLTGAIEAATELALPVCLMHMQGEPETMQVNPGYTDVVTEVLQFLLLRAERCMAAGIEREQIIIDPGFGFGKTLQHNLSLLAGLHRFVATGFPVMVGLSRKSMVRALADSPGSDLVAGSVTLALYAARHGAHIVRVHDVRQTVEALRIQLALDQSAVMR
jgi:dihydropteroate synthase